VYGYIVKENLLSLPDKLELAAANECWPVHYLKCDSALRLMERPCGEIVLFGQSKNIKRYKEKLNEWLFSRSATWLTQELHLLSNRMQLPFSKVTIRKQKTIWGSCTHNKAISLNYKLILLPKPLAQHVLIHELCHTKYLNHSKQFWQLVASFDSEWREHRKKLRQVQQFLPTWLGT
jgi:hypothetical protein